jgi:hypothetical protein
MAKAKSKRKTKSHAKPSVTPSNKPNAKPDPAPTPAAKGKAPKRPLLAPPPGYYATKRDRRFSLLIWGTALGMVGPTVALLWNQGGANWWLGTLLFTSATMALWTVQSMHYRLETGRLKINAGPFHWEIALADIRSVTPVRNAASAPAMSMDRLAIVYTDKGKDEKVLISPDDRQAFLQELGQLDRGLKRQDDGLQRR